MKKINTMQICEEAKHLRLRTKSNPLYTRHRDEYHAHLNSCEECGLLQILCRGASEEVMVKARKDLKMLRSRE